MGHTPETLALHRAMVAMGARHRAVDVVTALALTMAYAIRYNAASTVRPLDTFVALVRLEVDDPHSEMEKP